MITTVTDIVRRSYLLDTLPSFASIRPRIDMARLHLNLPDALLAQVQEFCDIHSITRSKFLTRGIHLALDDARKRFGEASNDPQATRPAPLSIAAPVASSDGAIPHIRRGETTWFDLKAVCATLSIEVESLMGEIDPDDDVLVYAGSTWIDGVGVGEAISLCRDPDAGQALAEWVQGCIEAPV